MTDWATEYHRDPSFARQTACRILGLTTVSPDHEEVIGIMTTIIRGALVEELESIVKQIEEYPISEDEIKRMAAEIRALYQ